VKGVLRTWLTIDTDDLRHVPSNQGHPTRSRPNPSLPDVSEQFREGFAGFDAWMSTHNHPVTLFVIADQCASDDFVEMMQSLIESYNERICIGCHGLHHRSWSAWREDVEGFSADLTESVRLLEHHFPNHFRKWFRAPAGYIAPWMFPVLERQGFRVDSSINPSWLVNKKYGKGNSWKTIQSAVETTSLIERSWKTRWTLPTCGPAQHITGLRWNAKSAWKRLSKPLSIDEMNHVEDSTVELDTIYWHILDHAKNNGTWTPPIKGL